MGCLSIRCLPKVPDLQGQPKAALNTVAGQRRILTGLPKDNVVARYRRHDNHIVNISFVDIPHPVNPFLRTAFAADRRPCSICCGNALAAIE